MKDHCANRLRFVVSEPAPQQPHVNVRDLTSKGHHLLPCVGDRLRHIAAESRRLAVSIVYATALVCSEPVETIVLS
jgi:hypothetical protein